jgi:hypothetical protein
MSNVCLGWPNRASLATLSGGSWVSLDNAKSRNTYDLARSTDTALASTKFNINLGTTNYSLGALTLHSHNLSQNALWRVSIGTTPGASNVYNSGWVSVWSVIFDNDLNTFEAGAYWPDVINDQNVRSHFSIISTFGDTKYANQYLTVEIDDTSNAAGYIEVGCLGLWSVFQPAKNMTWGASHGWQSLDDVSFAMSGEMLYEKRRAKRTANITFDLLTDSEGKTAYELTRRAGITGEVMYIPDPADLAYSQRYGFRGTLKTLGMLERSSIEVNKTEVQLLELI